MITMGQKKLKHCICVCMKSVYYQSCYIIKVMKLLNDRLKL